MKKILSLLIAALILTLSLSAFADGSALDAFYSLTGQTAQTNNPTKSNQQYLSEIMTGAYNAASQETLAGEVDYLAGITNKDLASYAAANKLSVSQVRNAYYRTLAKALDARIQTAPSTEGSRKNVETILDLFLSGDAAQEADREAIRRSMTPGHARTIAQDYGLSEEFVTFLIMDQNWADDQWKNDQDWRKDTLWDESASTTTKALKNGSRDSASSTEVAQLQEKLIALGYLTGKADGKFGPNTQRALIQYQRANGLPATGVYNDDDAMRLSSSGVVARWDYQDSFDDSPDNTPDNTPNRKPSQTTTTTRRDNSPDNTPDNSPDRNNTPDNSPDRDNT
ncbi:MAG: peptidoglycan-binding protein [Clostridia bacterium]|nr:peptidoglycan-binding protein [Clostridia bacterium]